MKYFLIHWYDNHNKKMDYVVFGAESLEQLRDYFEEHHCGLYQYQEVKFTNITGDKE